MSREIKFRVWDQYENKFSYSESYDNTCFLLNLAGRVVDGEGNSYKQGYPVQQFTGLKDKNGKEIYEGDILKGIDLFGLDGPYVGDVRYVPCRYQCFVKYPNGGYGGIVLDSGEVLEHKLEVIGNIFENQELL